MATWVIVDLAVGDSAVRLHDATPPVLEDDLVAGTSATGDSSRTLLLSVSPHGGPRHGGRTRKGRGDQQGGHVCSSNWADPLSVRLHIDEKDGRGHR
jgi:hypothetical protein